MQHTPNLNHAILKEKSIVSRAKCNPPPQEVKGIQAMQQARNKKNSTRDKKNKKNNNQIKQDKKKKRKGYNIQSIMYRYYNLQNPSRLRQLLLPKKLEIPHTNQNLKS